MNHPSVEVRELVVKAREALRRGDRPLARQLGEQAALRAPEMEDVWLILAASDPSPDEALAYAQKALQLNPQSARARQAIDWTSKRVKQSQSSQAKDAGAIPQRVAPNRAEAVTGIPKKRAYQTAVALPELKSNGRNWLIPMLLTGAGFVLVGLIVTFLLTSPMFASIVNGVNAPKQESLWAPANIAKPGEPPIDESAFVAQPDSSNPDDASPTDSISPTRTASADSVDMPEASETPAPTDAPTEAPSATPAATETPGTMAMQIIADTPTSAYVPPTYSAPKNQVASGGNGGRWIDVDLSQQMVYAYEGDTVVNSFLVSTGTSIHPTVTGKYSIYMKIRSGNMSGPGYSLPNVPYIMYFYKGYGLHGTYWHSNFGTPMSHGCVNLRTDEAAWLFNWASVGTVVNVHY